MISRLRSTFSALTIAVIAASACAQQLDANQLSFGWSYTYYTAPAAISRANYVCGAGTNGILYTAYNNPPALTWVINMLTNKGGGVIGQSIPVGSSVAVPHHMVVDSHCHVILSGTTNSFVYKGKNDVPDSLYVLALDSWGNKLWSRTIPGSPGGASMDTELFVDSHENVYLTGSLSTGPFGITSPTPWEMAFAKFDMDGKALFTREFGQWRYPTGSFDRTGNFWGSMGINGQPANCAWGEFSAASGLPIWQQQTNSASSNYRYNIGLSPNNDGTYYLTSHIWQYGGPGGSFLRETGRIALYDASHRMQWLSDSVPSEVAYMKGTPATGVLASAHGLGEAIKFDAAGHASVVAEDGQTPGATSLQDGFVYCNSGEFAQRDDNGQVVFAFYPELGQAMFTNPIYTEAPDGSFYLLTNWLSQGYAVHHFVQGVALDSIQMPTTGTNTAPVNATFNLTGPAPSGGASIQVTVRGAEFPTGTVATINIPAGQTSTSLSIDTSKMKTYTVLELVGTYNGSLRIGNTAVIIY